MFLYKYTCSIQNYNLIFHNFFELLLKVVTLLTMLMTHYTNHTVCMTNQMTINLYLEI